MFPGRTTWLRKSLCFQAAGRYCALAGLRLDTDCNGRSYHPPLQAVIINAVLRHMAADLVRFRLQLL